jgi:hypothetical protein
MGQGPGKGVLAAGLACRGSLLPLALLLAHRRLGPHEQRPCGRLLCTWRQRQGQSAHLGSGEQPHRRRSICGGSHRPLSTRVARNHPGSACRRPVLGPRPSQRRTIPHFLQQRVQHGGRRGRAPGGGGGPAGEGSRTWGPWGSARHLWPGRAICGAGLLLVQWQRRPWPQLLGRARPRLPPERLDVAAQAHPGRGAVPGPCRSALLLQLHQLDAGGARWLAGCGRGHAGAHGGEQQLDGVPQSRVGLERRGCARVGGGNRGGRGRIGVPPARDGGRCLRRPAGRSPGSGSRHFGHLGWCWSDLRRQVLQKVWPAAAAAAGCAGQRPALVRRAQWHTGDPRRGWLQWRRSPQAVVVGRTAISRQMAQLSSSLSCSMHTSLRRIASVRAGLRRPSSAAVPLARSWEVCPTWKA